MKKHLHLALLLLAIFLISTPQTMWAQTTAPNSESAVITYKDITYTLGPKCFYVTTQKEAASLAPSPYIFTDMLQALASVTPGTADSPMQLLIAPSVYWLDNPDDPEVRRVKHSNGTPYGVVVDCPYLHMIGLGEGPEDVVLAVNRGQTQGAMGNYTMMLLKGDGIEAENITFGNYCNVDLVYPRDPSLNRPRRANAIVQAQLVHCAGSDRVYVRRCRFISRLNLCPFTGARRTLFEDCHFECTDDALSGSAIYKDCHFTFFSSKPFYGTATTGAIFLNCDIDLHTRRHQYLTKVPGVVSMIDCRFKTLYDANQSPIEIGWTRDASATICYQSGITLNGQPYFIDGNRPDQSIEISQLPILKAYKLIHDGKTFYNLPNLLAGNDAWDPTGTTPLLRKIEEARGESLTGIPVRLSVSPTRLTMEAQGATEVLETQYLLWGNFPTTRDSHNMLTQGYNRWEGSAVVKLQPRDFNTAFCTSRNQFSHTADALVTCTADCGLRGATQVHLKPYLKEAPTFTAAPTLTYDKKQRAIILSYRLSPGTNDDCSRVVWYKYTSPDQSDTIAVLQGEERAEKLIYPLSKADKNYRLMAVVTPRYRDTKFGTPVTVSLPNPISEKQVSWDVFKEYLLHTDFDEIPCGYQPQILPGFWTFDAFKPSDTAIHDWTPDPQNAWYYGTAMDAAVGKGLVQRTRGARLFYTPAREKCNDMRVHWVVDPCKSAGQGFGSATGQYMDLYIKMDAKTLTGYGLRIARTPQYDKAVVFTLMRYDNGVATPIAQPQAAACYRTSCTIEIELRGRYLTATASTSAPLDMNGQPADVVEKVLLKAVVEPLPGTSLGIQHTGSAGGGATLIHHLEAEWKI